MKLRNKIRNTYILQILYFFLAILLYIGLRGINNNEIYNAIIAFFVIDISNAERKNLNYTEKKHFYDTISLISSAVVCGFVAPLFYISILGNTAGILFTLFYNLSLDQDLKVIGILVHIAEIIPALIAELFLYIIYVFRNKEVSINFKGDYFSNLYKTPLLNVDILAAYIESVNFYFHYNEKNMHYLKSYGGYINKIDGVCIKDYLSISYSICFILFSVFVFLQIIFL